MTGRMGILMMEETRAAGHVIAGGTRRPGAPATPELHEDMAALAAASDVVIDFTHASAAAGHAAALAEAGVAWVLGTSGLSADQDRAVAQAAELIPVVYAPSFAPGVALVLELAERLGAALPADTYDAEITEMHHRHKVDAPSGTAMGLGRAVAQGRGVRLPDVMVSGRDGHTGPRPDGAIGFASLRGGEVVGEHTLLFASRDEHIAVTHRAFDRRVFASGAVQAAGWAVGRPAGLYSMLHVLGMR